MSIHVSALYIYPIKACRGISVASADIVQRGLRGDRRWMIVDESGKFVTQREIPKLTLVETELDGQRIRLTAPGLASLYIPSEHDVGERTEVQVWKHHGPAVVHDEGSAWFSEYLGAPHRLVYMPSDHERRVKPERARPEDIVSFADGYPLLLISEESLTALNDRLAQPVSMQRFRPNIVVSGASAFAEDTWKHFTIAGTAFRGVKRCDRCSVTTVDLETAERGREPLATLAKFRQEDGAVWFGMNVIHDSTGTLSVGDELRIESST